MTKLLVCSDIHGRRTVMEAILAAHADADVILFLGDGERDFEALDIPDAGRKKIFNVCGNCDMHSSAAVSRTEKVDGRKLFMTHGHFFHVKSGTEYLAMTARDAGCDMAFFGHTHDPYYEDVLGVHLFNPGAVLEGCYGIVELSEHGISFTHWQIRFDADTPYSEQIAPVRR